MSSDIIQAMFFDDRFYKKTIDHVEHTLASVTTKLSMESKPFLYRYYAELGWDQAKKKLNEAGERGKRIHYAWYIYTEGGKVIFNDPKSPIYSRSQIEKLEKEANGLISILTEQNEMVDMVKLMQFDELVKPGIVKSESTVFSVQLGIAGTIDNVFLLEKGKYSVHGGKKDVEILDVPKTGLYISDLKTGKVISDSAWSQVSAYGKAFQDNSGEKIQGALILHTGSSRRTGIEGFSALIKTTEELEPDYRFYQLMAEAYNIRNPGKGPKCFEFPSIIERKNKGDKK